jgi:hypothetical protein
MPYIQITKCIAPSDYDRSQATTWDAFLRALAVSGITLGALALILVSLFGGPIGWGVSIAVAFCAFAASLKDGINNKRLVCIGKDKCIIGIVMPGSLEPPGLGIDNDYSFNLMPLPHNVEDDRSHVINDGYLGTLFITDRPEITAIGLETDLLPEHRHHNNIHCELEGDRPNVFADALCVAGVIIGAAIAAGELLAFLGLPVLVIVVIVAFIILAAITGIIAATYSAHDGNAEDAADDIISATISEWDVFVVKGDRVFEGGHFPGWNEIHPVKHLQKLWNEQKNPSGIIGIKNASIDASMFIWVQALVNRWCDAIKEGADRVVIDAQNQPENQWTDHPSVDGCAGILVIS